MATRRGWRSQYSQYQSLNIPASFTFIVATTLLFGNFGFSISFRNRSGGKLSQLSNLRSDFTYTDQLLNACKDIDPCINVHVFGYRRFDATRQLLNMLSEANYSTYFHGIPLIIHVGRPSGKGISEKVLQNTEKIVNYVKGV